MLLITVLSALVTCVAGFSYFVTKFFFLNAAKFSDALTEEVTHIHHYAPPPAPKPVARKPVVAADRFVALHGAPRPSASAVTRVIPVVKGRDPASVSDARILQSHKAMGALLAWADADED